MFLHNLCIMCVVATYVIEFRKMCAQQISSECFHNITRRTIYSIYCYSAAVSSGEHIIYIIKRLCARFSFFVIFVFNLEPWKWIIYM